jgi:DNA modification methylase
MSVTLLRGDALALPIADSTIDLALTSPPYFGLRSYQDGGQHYPGQIGSEPTPREFVDSLIQATREMVRVLKPSGSIWVNLGDKYANDSKWGGSTGGKHVPGLRGPAGPGRGKLNTGIPAKSLMGLPWRYAIRCIDELGLILRAEVIWSKPNGLPESVADRIQRSHEQWFHFTVQPRYFAAVDEIREPRIGGCGGRGDYQTEAKSTPGSMGKPLGKLPGSVWSVPTQSLTVPESLGVDHFAAFPMEWPRRIITGWSPPGICTGCGEGRRPVSNVDYVRTRRMDKAGTRTSRNTGNNRDDAALPFGSSAHRLTTITGERCGCPEPTAPTRPAVVLDPFGGTGTVAMVADALGRHGVSVELSGDYCRLAKWRTNDPNERARAAQVDKPPPIPEGMDTLFGATMADPTPDGRNTR